MLIISFRLRNQDYLAKTKKKFGCVSWVLYPNFISTLEATGPPFEMNPTIIGKDDARYGMLITK